MLCFTGHCNCKLRVDRSLSCVLTGHCKLCVDRSLWVLCVDRLLSVVCWQVTVGVVCWQVTVSLLIGHCKLCVNRSLWVVCWQVTMSCVLIGYCEMCVNRSVSCVLTGYCEMCLQVTVRCVLTGHCRCCVLTGPHPTLWGPGAGYLERARPSQHCPFLWRNPSWGKNIHVCRVCWWWVMPLSMWYVSVSCACVNENHFVFWISVLLVSQNICLVFFCLCRSVLFYLLL